MKNETTSPLQNLKDLKRKLDSGQMSVLVGAGFGKNIDSMFPSWWELLFDMAYFLYGKKIEESYLAISVKKRGDKQKYVDDKITDFIEKVGYLDLVTEYVKRKGFQESITTYIEEKTPRVIEDKGKRYITNIVKGKKNKIELTDSMLDLHSSLINLPWNNIYTTNYDEMLELSNDKTNEEKLLLIQEEIEQKNKDLYIQLEEMLKNKETDENELALLEEQEKTKIVIDGSLSVSTSTPQLITAEIREKRNKLHYLSYDLKRVQTSIKQNDVELLKVKKEIEKCLKPVVHSSDLAIKRNRNIIKLHGSIRNENDTYGFDNDIRSHYVISREDYDLYPQKHEAFTQLMRISLLQESYCLIGFSGVDPNFLEWIKWVRDVLERSRDSKKTYKIYLIEVGKSKTLDDKELFYENFRICKVSLEDDSIIGFLENETGLKLDKNIDRKKALLSLLFSYLKEENFDTPNLFIQQHNISKYRDEWNSVKTFNGYSKTTEEIKEVANDILKHYDAIILNKDCTRIKQQDFAFSRNKMNLLHFSAKLLSDLNNDPIKQKKLFDLILIAIEDMMLPIKKVWDESELQFIENLLETEQEENRFNLLKLRDSLLSFDEAEFSLLANKLNSDLDFVKYERITLLAFSLDFKKMKAVLDDWQPNEANYILKKAGSLALINPKEAEEYLSSKKNVFEKSNVEELLFYYQSIRYLETDRNYGQTKIIDSYISTIESKGFKGIHKHFDNILEDLKTKPEKIDRYGSGRFSLNRGFSLSNDLTKTAKSIQFIQLILELGLPLKIGYYTLNSIEEWYEVFKNIFEEFPIPCLFYSLQYSDEKVLRRIGQDYAYSEKLTDFNNQILPKLLNDYLVDETPWRFKKSFLYFCSELFVSVNPNIWESKFLLIWKNLEFQKYSFDSKRNEEYIFVVEAIKCIKKAATYNSIILSCLNNYENDVAIDFLYHIANNDYFLPINIQNKRVSEKLNELIDQLPQKEGLLFVFGNLNLKLTKVQKAKINEQLKKYNFNTVKNERVWKVLYFYIKDEPILLEKFKNGLIKSKRLFHTGFNPSGSLSMQHNFVSSAIFSNDKIWNATEIKTIYRRLLSELKKIEKWLLKRDETNFDFMFQEMLLFLESESKVLNEIKGYKDVLTKIRENYNADKGYTTITEAITSDDKSKIIWALSEMSQLIHDKKIYEDVSTALQLLLNRVLFQNDVALEATLNYIAVWIYDKSNKTIFEQHKILLRLIFEKYSKSYPKNVDIPFIQKQLIIIASSYLEYFDKDDIVENCKLLFSKKEYFNS
jgi:hypothetical protein